MLVLETNMATRLKRSKQCAYSFGKVQTVNSLSHTMNSTSCHLRATMLEWLMQWSVGRSVLLAVFLVQYVNLYCIYSTSWSKILDNWEQGKIFFAAQREGVISRINFYDKKMSMWKYRGSWDKIKRSMTWLKTSVPSRPSSYLVSSSSDDSHVWMSQQSLNTKGKTCQPPHIVVDQCKSPSDVLVHVND